MNIVEYKDYIKSIAHLVECTKPDPDVFSKLGVMVIRNAVPVDLVSEWRRIWTDFRSEHYGSTETRVIENKFNPVEVKAELPADLKAIAKHPAIVKLMKPIFGENIGLYHQRFVVKDSSSKGAVMLHNDTCYHVGCANKASLFLALTPVNANNGAMSFYLGTSAFGNLGDAGQLNRAVLPEDWPIVTPELAPGDLALMNSQTWHESGAFISGNERVMTDFIYQDANDPSTVEVACGTQAWDDGFLVNNRADLFLQCRSKKLGQIKNVLDSTTA